MFKGYLELSGVPLINSEATEAYLAHLLPGSAMRATINSTALHLANEEDAYRTPLLDSAPWANALDPASHGFLGFYPIEIEGLDDDTTESSVTEYLTEGGSTGLQRRASRSIRVTGLLAATNPLSVQFGRDWLAAALQDSDCVGCGTDGLLRYFVAEPDLCETGAFGPEDHVQRRAFGKLNPGVFRYRWPSSVDPNMPMRARWDATWAEGTAIRYGIADKDDAGELYSSAVLQPFRRNYVRNATFRSSLNNWTVAGGGTAVRLDGGIDNAGFARLAAASGAGSGAFGVAAFGTGSFGGTGSRLSGLTTTVPAGAMLLSAQVRTPATSRVSVLAADGSLLTAADVPASADWARIALPVTVPSAGVLTLVFSTDTWLDIDQVLLEVGNYQGGYFDGSSGTIGTVSRWEGALDDSSSTLAYTDPFEVTWDDSDNRPFLQVVAGSAPNAQLSYGIRLPIPLETQLLPYERHLFDVSCVSGVKVIKEVDAGAAGAYLQVEFALVAGKPSPLGLPEEVDTTPLSNAIYFDPALVAVAQDTAWLSDPNATVVTLPPQAPVILNPAIELITSWRRYYVPIDADTVADWGESIPTVAITSHAAAISQVRVRFHPNPFGYAPTAVDATAYCSEFVVSYLPALTRLEVNGATQRTTASRGDRASTPADHLLYGTDGGPIIWPELSCAIPYLMTVDVPTSGTIDQFDLELSLRRKR